MYEKIREKFGRDSEIARAYRAGIQRSELAKRYDVSKSAIEQAIKKAEAEANRARDVAAFTCEFATTSRMKRQWPCERLFAGLGFDTQSRRAMTAYYVECRGKHEISMRDLMDTLIPQWTGHEKAGDLFMKWVHDHRWNEALCCRVPVTCTDEAAQVFAEFPAFDGLRDFDVSDRKFVAVANAHPEKPPIVEAVDYKWLGWKNALAKAGIGILFVDADAAAAGYAKHCGHD